MFKHHNLDGFPAQQDLNTRSRNLAIPSLNTPFSIWFLPINYLVSTMYATFQHLVIYSTMHIMHCSIYDQMLIYIYVDHNLYPTMFSMFQNITQQFG